MRNEATALTTPPPNDATRDWDDDLAEIMLLPPRLWQDPGYNVFHFAKTGCLLGSLAGCTSLVANVIGSVLWPSISGEAQHPLRLIQAYLTFPLGEDALTLNSGVLLALGCIVYLLTGMLYGIAFELAISYLIPHVSARGRLLSCSVLALIVWIVNFYGLLVWLQPLLFRGRWIIELIPWWVAAVTHLVFGWTMALLYPLGTSVATKVDTA